MQTGHDGLALRVTCQPYILKSGCGAPGPSACNTVHLAGVQTGGDGVALRGAGAGGEAAGGAPAVQAPPQQRRCRAAPARPRAGPPGSPQIHSSFIYYMLSSPQIELGPQVVLKVAMQKRESNLPHLICGPIPCTEAALWPGSSRPTSSWAPRWSSELTVQASRAAAVTLGTGILESSGAPSTFSTAAQTEKMTKIELTPLDATRQEMCCAHHARHVHMAGAEKLHLQIAVF